MASLLLRQAQDRNTALKCSLPSCGQARHRLRTWCVKHFRTAERVGHPSAPAYRPKEWAAERQEVLDLFEANPSHRGLLQVTEAVEAWMVSASSSSPASAPGGPYKGHREVTRLATAGVTPRALLVELCAAFMWLSERPRALPDDRSRDFFLARALFALAPRPRRRLMTPGWYQKPAYQASYAVPPLPSALAHVGRHLRTTYAVFMVNVTAGVQTAQAAKRDPKVLHREPFELPRQAPGPGQLPFTSTTTTGTAHP